MSYKIDETGDFIEFTYEEDGEFVTINELFVGNTFESFARKMENLLRLSEITLAEFGYSDLIREMENKNIRQITKILQILK